MTEGFHGGRRPIGFEADGVTPRPLEVAALVEAAAQLVAGETLTSVTRMVQQAVDEARPPGEPQRRVSREGVKTVLLGDRLLGPRTNISHPSTAGVITAQTQEEVRAVLAIRGKTRGRHPERSLLAGLLWCGSCGQRLICSRDAYACPAQRSGVPDGCGSRGERGVAVRSKPLEAVVEARVLQSLRARCPETAPDEAAWDRLSTRMRREVIRRTTSHILILGVGFSGGGGLDPARVRIHMRGSECSCTVIGDPEVSGSRVLIDAETAQAYRRERHRASTPRLHTTLRRAGPRSASPSQGPPRYTGGVKYGA